MDPLTPCCDTSQKYKNLKFTAFYTPQIHPTPTPSYSGNTWATPHNQDNTLSNFSFPSVLAPCLEYNHYTATCDMAQITVVLPFYSPTAWFSKATNKQPQRNSNTENIVPPPTINKLTSSDKRLQDLDAKIKHTNLTLHRLWEECKMLRIRKYMPRQKVAEKIEKILDFLEINCKWKLSAFSWHLSKLKGNNGKNTHCENRHA